MATRIKMSEGDKKHQIELTEIAFNSICKQNNILIIIVHFYTDRYTQEVIK